METSWWMVYDARLDIVDICCGQAECRLTIPDPRDPRLQWQYAPLSGGRPSGVVIHEYHTWNPSVLRMRLRQHGLVVPKGLWPTRRLTEQPWPERSEASQAPSLRPGWQRDVHPDAVGLRMRAVPATGRSSSCIFPRLNRRWAKITALHSEPRRIAKSSLAAERAPRRNASPSVAAKGPSRKGRSLPRLVQASGILGLASALIFGVTAGALATSSGNGVPAPSRIAAPGPPPPAAHGTNTYSPRRRPGARWCGESWRDLRVPRKIRQPFFLPSTSRRSNACRQSAHRLP